MSTLLSRKLKWNVWNNSKCFSYSIIKDYLHNMHDSTCTPFTHRISSWTIQVQIISLAPKQNGTVCVCYVNSVPRCTLQKKSIKTFHNLLQPLDQEVMEISSSGVLRNLCSILSTVYHRCKAQWMKNDNGLCFRQQPYGACIRFAEERVLTVPAWYISSSLQWNKEESPAALSR